jgi:aminomethyltransferase
MAEVVPATDDDAKIVRLEHAQPRWGEEITSRYLGPEIGLDEAIARSKGCYLGQEVVERVRSRGLLGRLLVPVRIATTVVISAGEQVMAGQRRVGEVVSAGFSPRFGQVVGSAYIQTGFLDGQHELVCESSRAVVEIQPRFANKGAE